MARYTGPTTKKARAFGEPIFGYDKAYEKRKYPPGQHGAMKKRKQRTDYAFELIEKQKAKYTYGVLERQFRNLFEKAAAKSGVTGEILLQLLESRLDNVENRETWILLKPTFLQREMVLKFMDGLNGTVTRWKGGIWRIRKEKRYQKI